MMRSDNLQKFPFLGRIGGFGIEPKDPHDVAAGLRYAKRLLDGPNRLVWIFPQGVERPVTERPLNFLPAAASLARLVPHATVIASGLRYEFGADERPTMLGAFGKVTASGASRDELAEAQQQEVVTQLERIESHVCRPSSAFEAVLQYAPKRMSFAQWLLGRMTRYA